jgi:hypothetical protein
MENAGISKYSVSFGLSLAAASVINALLVVAKEKSPSVMAGLQRLTGHHWISHAVIVVVLFVAFGSILALPNQRQGIKITGNRLIGLLLSGVVVGAVIIVGFYLTEG